MVPRHGDRLYVAIVATATLAVLLAEAARRVRIWF